MFTSSSNHANNPAHKRWEKKEVESNTVVLSDDPIEIEITVDPISAGFSIAFRLIPTTVSHEQISDLVRRNTKTVACNTKINEQGNKCPNIEL